MQNTYKYDISLFACKKIPFHTITANTNITNVLSHEYDPRYPPQVELAGEKKGKGTRFMAQRSKPIKSCLNIIMFRQARALVFDMLINLHYKSYCIVENFSSRYAVCEVEVDQHIDMGPGHLFRVLEISHG